MTQDHELVARLMKQAGAEAEKLRALMVEHEQQKQRIGALAMPVPGTPTAPAELAEQVRLLTEYEKHLTEIASCAGMLSVLRGELARAAGCPICIVCGIPIDVSRESGRCLVCEIDQDPEFRNGPAADAGFRSRWAKK